MVIVIVVVIVVIVLLVIIATTCFTVLVFVYYGCRCYHNFESYSNTGI